MIPFGARPMGPFSGANCQTVSFREFEFHPRKESVDPAVFRGGLTAPKSAARTGPVNVTGTASDQETWRKRRFGQLGVISLGDQT